MTISLPIVEAKDPIVPKKKLALVSFSYSKNNSTLLKKVEEFLPKGKIVNEMPGWGKLDQLWYELETEIYLSKDWCRPVTLSDSAWKELYSLLDEGKLFMMVHYLDDEWLMPHSSND